MIQQSHSWAVIIFPNCCCDSQCFLEYPKDRMHWPLLKFMNCCYQCYSTYLQDIVTLIAYSLHPSKELKQPVCCRDAHVAATKVKLMFLHFNDDSSFVPTLLFLRKAVYVFGQGLVTRMSQYLDNPCSIFETPFLFIL